MRNYFSLPFTFVHKGVYLKKAKLCFPWNFSMKLSLLAYPYESKTTVMQQQIFKNLPFQNGSKNTDIFIICDAIKQNVSELTSINLET